MVYGWLVVKQNRKKGKERQMVGCVVGGIFFAQMLVRSGSPMNVPLAERVANDFKDKSVGAAFVH